jgi:lipopolysaccharide export system permease protein
MDTVSDSMKLIDKHLLREFLTAVFYCMAGFAIILIISELSGDMQRILRVKPPMHLITRFYISLLGPALQYLAPASLMLATLYTLHGLTRNNELTAMRASGISIYRILMPFLAVGFSFSVATAVLSETWIPHAIEWVQEIRENKFKPVETKVFDLCIYLNQADHRQWIINDFDAKHPGTLRDVEIKQENESGQRKYVITAPMARYLDGQWWLFGAEIQQFGNDDNPIHQKKPLGLSPESVVEMREYNEHPDEFVSSVRPWEFLNIREMYHYLETNKKHLSKKDLAKKKYAFHSQIAMPWACFIVILFAIPAGARTGRQGALVAVFSAIGLLAGFYALAQVGLILGSMGLLPPIIGAWLANFVFFIIGFVMMARIR